MRCACTSSFGYTISQNVNNSEIPKRPIQLRIGPLLHLKRTKNKTENMAKKHILQTDIPRTLHMI